MRQVPSAETAAQLRQEVTPPRLRVLLPLTLVLLSLVSFALGPLLVGRRIAALREELTEVIDPAHARVTEVQLALALEAAYSRGYLLTGESVYAEKHREARHSRDTAYARLLPLAHQLGPRVMDAAVSLNAEFVTLEAPGDSLFAGLLSRETFLGRHAMRRLSFERMITAAHRLDNAITQAEVERRQRIVALGRINAALTLLSVLLALLAVFLVARLSRAYRVLALHLQQRVREQTALRRAARSLSATLDASAAAQAIVDHAMAMTGAGGAYLESMTEADHEVKVAAVAGRGTPPQGAHISYPDSMAASVASRAPEPMARIGAFDEEMAPYLQRICPGCSGLIVPLVAEARPMGVLVLLRQAGVPPFGEAEAMQARALGDLASPALWRVRLHEAVREGEERFRQIAENFREFIWLSNRELSEYYYVSPAYEQIWGRSRESLYEDPYSLFAGLHPDDRARVEAKLEGLQRGDYDIEFRVIRPDGELRWVWSRGFPVFDARGELYRIAGISEDITTRKLAEAERERLMAREQAALHRVSTTLESISDAFFSVDRDWRITYANQRAAEAIRGAARGQPDELLGRSLWEVIPELEGTLFGSLHRRAMAEERPLHLEAFFPPWDRWFDVHDYPSEYGLSIYFQDVTERKRGEEERGALLARMAEKNQQLERVMESRARLIRGFSHDLKNPLGAADGYAALLEEGIMGQLEPRQHEGIARIRSSLQASLGLIEDLLELARAEAGQIELHPQMSDIGLLAREVADAHRAQAAAAGLELEVRVPDDALETETDPVRVRQVLGNLVTNAVKYTQAGRIRVVAEARAEGPGAGRSIVVSVSDTGPGIPPEMHEQVFAEFERLDHDTKQGAGIGLAISRRLARLLGGDITVESELGKGSTFTFWLPQTAATPAASQRRIRAVPRSRVPRGTRREAHRAARQREPIERAPHLQPRHPDHPQRAQR